MRITIALLAVSSPVGAFVPHTSHSPFQTRLFSTETTDKVPIEITGQNIELTPALVDHVNKRIGGPINKLAKGGAVKECDVVLSVSKNPKVIMNECVYVCLIRWTRDWRMDRSEGACV